MRYSLLFLCSSVLLACQPSDQTKSTCSKRKELEFYINNDSSLDSLVHAHVVLDDTVLVNAPIRRRHTGSEYQYSAFPICPGKHQVKVHFGSFYKDTLLFIRGDQSFFVSLSHASYEGADNGIAIALLEHDYNWYHRID